MRLLIAGLPLLLVLASCADLPAACGHGAKNACSSNAVQVRDDQRFMDAAWNEYVRRGGTYLRSNARLAIYRELGHVIVSVTLHPPFPGGHFEVTLDAKTGSVLKYLPGA